MDKNKRAALLENLIMRAKEEDLSEGGDITSQAIFSSNHTSRAVIKAKEAGVVSGIHLITPVFHAFSSSLSVELCVSDGSRVAPQTPLAYVTGETIAILSAERLVLNLLQRFSGIATVTRRMVDCLGDCRTRILDTRKTTPTLRFLEKEAVLHGGGVNHRFGLYDMIMAKDTHVRAAGGPDKAVAAARAWLSQAESSVKIEVEVECLDDFQRALSAGPDIIMLDNMSCEDMAQAVHIRDKTAPSVLLEASGNVTEERIGPISQTGVDYISVGALTHSVQALDIHLQLL
ncbi:carboxylating nicotinate-nucleotide diphosphorylase [Chitinivibrio alkaliphilus]|uniref:Probable nicotinate-nucleotide pyrophosphorylase [carboxylating] n=1 Tax=Chitinivibrio alkaliphilus ACht1 TaxID=1313304 RepID=U7D4R8_9BACT|nr:carboxylating nicotinate-nucleotide diphosphorylase [Chitinivibrio alkaliphilus]ERP30933.1 nicotinate-nucleotide pyrophosphorylase [Chitinivibrio alkaliphilus ACht1]